MKVIKSILIAVVLGIVYVGIGLMKIDNIKMSEILLANTMSGVEFYPQYISTFSFDASFKMYQKSRCDRI